MSIIWLSQSLRFLDLIVSKGISAGIFIKLTSLLMPRIFTILGPIALFTAVIFIYNRMLVDQELIVMKSAGISPYQLSKPTILLGIILALTNIYIINYGMPRAESAFKDLEWRIKNNISQLMFREGEFTNLQDNLTVFVTAHDDDGTVANILIDDERNPQLKSTTTAEKGIVVQTDQGPRIILINGYRQEINKKKGTFSAVSFSQYSVDFGIKESTKKRKDSVRTHSFGELITALNNENLTPNEQYKWFVEGNRRITTPLLAIVYAFLACTGLLISNFNRRGQTQVVGLSIIAIIIIQAIDLTAGNLAGKNLWWLVLLYGNIFIPMGICLMCLLKPDITKKTIHRSIPASGGINA